MKYSYSEDIGSYLFLMDDKDFRIIKDNKIVVHLSNIGGQNIMKFVETVNEAERIRARGRQP